jgi:hypothetical protein
MAQEGRGRAVCRDQNGKYAPECTSPQAPQSRLRVLTRIGLGALNATGLSATTIEHYEQHLRYHISPYFGDRKLTELAPKDVRQFEDRLHHDGRLSAMIRKVLVSLGSLLADAQDGLVGRDVVRDLWRNRRKCKERQAEKRGKRKLRVGLDIPSPAEIRVILTVAQGRWRPLLMVAAFPPA